MKRFFLFATIVICNIQYVTAQEYISYPGLDSVILTENELWVETYSRNFNDKNIPSPLIETYKVISENKDGFLYITFDYDGVFLSDRETTINHGKKRYLVLRYEERWKNVINDLEMSKKLGIGEHIAFYGENNKLVYFAAIDYALQPDSYRTDVVATSELKDNNITYKAKNLLGFVNLNPWVEGVEGSGIGEKLKFTLKTESTYITFSNGYVDYNKPYLYRYNNRVKKIRIEYEGKHFDHDIPDNPNFIFIHFDKSVKSFTVKILEVYKGIKWDDTCINAIVPDYNRHL
ncbi:MAG: hypothetical protein Ta2G_18100 [Termitinemataceae bacterium]|nr:MAG: hypothetical protein Ta2G_18100 [Termitinemataceae bacterium]